MSIVIADDHERERIWLRELLTKKLPAQLPVHEAINGEHAVDLVKLHNPSLVFLDIEMPVLSGINAAQKIFFTSAPFQYGRSLL